MDYTHADVESLAVKLDALELTVGEQAALEALVSQAETRGEVTGYARRKLGDIKDGSTNTILMRTLLLSVTGYIDDTSTYPGTDGAST